MPIAGVGNAATFMTCKILSLDDLFDLSVFGFNPVQKPRSAVGLIINRSMSFIAAISYKGSLGSFVQFIHHFLISDPDSNSEMTWE